jgi:polar amino acid transport system substrate-binding protein
MIETLGQIITIADNPNRCARLHTLCRAAKATARTLILTIAMLIAMGTLGIDIGPARAQAQMDRLRVVIKPLTPFVMFEGERNEGFSIDLWVALASHIDKSYEFVRVDSVERQLETVESGDADVAITGISITREREARIDFSLPYFDSGLQIMTRIDEGVTFLDIVKQFFSPTLLRVMALMALTIFVTANLIWLIERHRNSEDFPKPYLRGLWEGLWWSVSTLSSGSGEVNPRSVLGRIVAVLWMFVAIFLIANFTAVMTTNLTMQNLRGSIASVDDLPGKTVATVDGSTASRYLSERGIAHQRVKLIEDAYALMDKGQAQAVVYDAPVLRYFVNTDGREKFKLVGTMFNSEKYGIALPSGSPLREEINRALLQLIEDGTYDDIYTRWFGVAR